MARDRAGRWAGTGPGAGLGTGPGAGQAPRPRHSAPRPLDLSAIATTANATAATATAAPLQLLLLRLLLLLPSLLQPLPPRTPPSLPAMTSLHRNGGSGDGCGGSSGSGGGHPSSRCGAARWGVFGGGHMWVQQRQHEALTPQQLREWYTSRGGGGGSSGGCSTAIQLGVTGGGLPKLQRRPRETLSPQQLREWYVQRGASRGSARCPYVIRTGDQAGQTCGTGVDIFTLECDAILSAMYALSASAEGDCSQCVPPNPGIAAAALGASESGTLPGQVAASCSCRLLSHQTLLWHHCLGHPSLPRLCDMHSRLFVSGLPKSLPPLPPSPASPCLPCVEGRQRAAPHSSSLPPTTSPLQTLYMDMWGPARVNEQGRERYFLLVVDDHTWYTKVFPLRRKGEVVDVLIPWIRTVRLELSERFSQDLPVLHLHSDRGGEFSFILLRDFCRGEGILQSFMLPDSPQQNGIAERRIGLVMEVARTSMIHAAAPHFMWPFA
ncbi:unnamed protein product, partial [Closterium sp. NIES-54]